MRISNSQLTSSRIFDCDVLVIGSGPGGAVTAHELVIKGVDVLMLEEGPISKPSQDITSARGLQKYWRSNGLTAALGGTPIAYAEGRCVGGGSEINSAIIQRTPSNLLDQWANDYYIRDFSGATLTSYYDKAFRHIDAKKNSKPYNPLSKIIISGAAAMNWQVSSLERADDADGKRSMSQTLLKKATAQGLRIISECRVEKIYLKGSNGYSAKAIALDAQGQKLTITIHFKHVFLAAGAVHTPSLLLRSGIKKNIGRSLRLHPTLKVLANFTQLIDAKKHILSPYAVTEFMPDIRLGSSVFKPGFFGMALAEDWQNRSHLQSRIDNCAIYYAMIRAQGIGRVYSIPGLRDPLVTFRLTKHDWILLKEGLLSLTKLLFAAGALEIHPSLSGHPGWCGSTFNLSDPYLENIYKYANLFTIHLFSSCPMGENIERCATNSYGKVHNFDNIYIADASLIPEAPGVNPQATVMAITDRNIEHFLNVRK
jgi:choline dehydrogenase-like flavoprotein